MFYVVFVSRHTLEVPRYGTPMVVGPRVVNGRRYVRNKYKQKKREQSRKLLYYSTAEQGIRGRYPTESIIV